VNGLVRTRIKRRTHRLINSRYPTVGVFDDLARDAADAKAAFALEALTNDRMTMATERLSRLPDEEIVTGPGATLVMAAFLHADDRGGRFTDARLGGWYAALEIETAIAETLYHHRRRLSLSDGGFPARMEIRELIVSADNELVDLRGLMAKRPELYDPGDYAMSQAFGARLRWSEDRHKECGIVFDAVRRAGGTNVCLLWPSCVALPVVQGDHFAYHWDAKGEATVARLSKIIS
jgi:hypothetical protein